MPVCTVSRDHVSFRALRVIAVRDDDLLVHADVLSRDRVSLRALRQSVDRRRICFAGSDVPGRQPPGIETIEIGPLAVTLFRFAIATTLRALRPSSASWRAGATACRDRDASGQ